MLGAWDVPGLNLRKDVKEGRECNHFSVKITSSTKRGGVPGLVGKGRTAGEELEHRGSGLGDARMRILDSGHISDRPIFKLLLIFGQFPRVWGKGICVGML